MSGCTKRKFFKEVTMSDVRIKIGGEKFRVIRENSCFYADKTAFIEELLSGEPPEVSLITRPRRFGKTLMMTMLRDFFDIRQDSRALFEGLAISKNKEICDKWMNQCPVVFLTFKGIEGQTFEDALKKIRSRISNICIEYSFLSDSISVDERIRERLSLLKAESAEDSMLSDSLKTLCMALYAHYGKPAILLIDEYDVPLDKAHKYGYYDDMAQFIRSMLNEGLKTNDFLEFGILTGCLRISGESFFTGLNHFKCSGISDVRYADKFGFTSKDVDDLLALAGFSEKKEAIKAWYDGYVFGKNTEIYCPWDILQYVDDLQADPDSMPKAYWLNTSRNEIVRTFVEHCNASVIRNKLNALMTGSCIQARIIENLTYDRLYKKADNMWTVLYYSGYLTKAGPEQVKKCGIKPEPDQTVLAIPNKEVLEIFASVIAGWFEETVQNIDRTALFKAFWADDADALAKLLCDQMEDTLSYYDAREDFYHALLLGLFTFTGWDVDSNKEYGDGRPDIVVSDTENKRAAIIEIKRGRSQRGLPGLTEKAISQIRKNRYAAPLLKKEGWHVSLWGMAFFKKTCVLRVEAGVLNS